MSHVPGLTPLVAVSKTSRSGEGTGQKKKDCYSLFCLSKEKRAVNQKSFFLSLFKFLFFFNQEVTFKCISP